MLQLNNLICVGVCYILEHELTLSFLLDQLDSCPWVVSHFCTSLRTSMNIKLHWLCSSYFSVINGVRQGGILSPKLFSVYVDDLSVALSATKTGCVINDKSVSHAFYADDLCIMSASPVGLQKLIDICYNYSVQNFLTFNTTKYVCVVFKPKMFKLYCPPMVLNAAPLPYVDSVKYLGFMFTPDSKDDVDMQRQLRTFYACSNTIIRQFAKCDESVKLVLFCSFCSCYYCPYLWLDMTKHSARILRVAYNNAHTKILKLLMTCSASQMFADNNLLNFEALMRKMSNTFINRLISSDNAIIKVLLDNLVARERIWEYWYSILY